MKNRFERLSKEEQKAAIEEYKNARSGNEVVIKKLKNLRILSIVGIIYAVISFAYDILGNSKYIYSAFDGILLISCVVFFIQSRKLLVRNVNQYLIDIQKKELKEKRKQELENSTITELKVEEKKLKKNK